MLLPVQAHRQCRSEGGFCAIDHPLPGCRGCCIAPRNLTNTPGVMEREPQWAPDGRSVAYLSDESGENALHLRAQDGGGDIVKIPLKTGFYGSPRFSPDSRKIALVDSFQRLW